MGTANSITELTLCYMGAQTDFAAARARSDLYLFLLREGNSKEQAERWISLYQSTRQRNEKPTIESIAAQSEQALAAGWLLVTSTPIQTT